MKIEDRQLLLQDLSTRVPYGVKVSVNQSQLQNYDNKWKSWCFDEEPPEIDGVGIYGVTFGCMDMSDGVIDFEYIKPYLFPLESMTVEYICKVQNLLPNNCNISFKNQKITFYDEGNIQLEQLEKIFHFFNLYHFDYRGLIPMGLAIDATGLNIY